MESSWLLSWSTSYLKARRRGLWWVNSLQASVLSHGHMLGLNCRSPEDQYPDSSQICINS